MIYWTPILLIKIINNYGNVDRFLKGCSPVDQDLKTEIEGAWAFRPPVDIWMQLPRNLNIKHRILDALLLLLFAPLRVRPLSWSYVHTLHHHHSDSTCVLKATRFDLAFDVVSFFYIWFGSKACEEIGDAHNIYLCALPFWSGALNIAGNFLLF